MQALLQHDELWEAIEPEDPAKVDAKKDTKALSKIILMVDKVNYSHIKACEPAAAAWKALENAFEDSGLTRRVGLLRTLVTTQLNNFASVDEYCDAIATTAHKLNDMGFKVSEEWIGTLLLAGLPDDYRPMIMGLESSGAKISGDSVKVKLLSLQHEE